MKKLTLKRKTEIANAIIENSDFAVGLKQYRTIVRKMLLEAIDKALVEATDGTGNVLRATT